MSGESLGLALTELEPTEMVVIKALAHQFAQASVDLAVERARLAAVRTALAALWSLAKPIESGCDCLPPQGYIIPADSLITLQSLVG